MSDIKLITESYTLSPSEIGIALNEGCSEQVIQSLKDIDGLDGLVVFLSSDPDCLKQCAIIAEYISSEDTRTYDEIVSRVIRAHSLKEDDLLRATVIGCESGYLYSDELLDKALDIEDDCSSMSIECSPQLFVSRIEDIYHELKGHPVW